MSALVGSKMKIMVLVAIGLLGVGFVGSNIYGSVAPLVASIIAVGIEGGCAFIAYGLSDASWNLRSTK
jgi:hypothetical protein